MAHGGFDDSGALGFEARARRRLGARGWAKYGGLGFMSHDDLKSHHKKRAKQAM